MRQCRPCTSSNCGRGPQKDTTKVQITVRPDADVLAFFKAQGRGYQSRINIPCYGIDASILG